MNDVERCLFATAFVRWIYRARGLFSQVAYQGLEEIPLDTHISDTIVCGSGTAGPALDLQH